MTNHHIHFDMQNIDSEQNNQSVEHQRGQKQTYNNNTVNNKNNNNKKNNNRSGRKDALERGNAHHFTSDPHFRETDSKQIDFNQIAVHQYQLQASPYQLFLQCVPASGRIGIWLRDNPTTDLNSATDQGYKVDRENQENQRSKLLGYYSWEEQCWYHQNRDIRLSSAALIEIEAYASGYALRRSADFSTKRTLAHYLSHYAGYTL